VVNHASICCNGNGGALGLGVPEWGTREWRRQAEAEAEPEETAASNTVRAVFLWAFNRPGGSLKGPAHIKEPGPS
jgi:hypothetical protein